MIRILAAFMLLAMPAQAQDCFSGQPRQVRYDDGRMITIIQRHGDDLTYTTPYEGNQDTVQKTHLMLFPKQARFGARSSENRWTSRLPRLGDMTPGYAFDIKGTMKSGEGEALPYRIEGEVLREEAVMVGDCSYDSLVISQNTYLKGEVVLRATLYLNADMVVLLKSQVEQVLSGKVTSFTAVGLQ